MNRCGLLFLLIALSLMACEKKRKYVISGSFYQEAFVTGYVDPAALTLDSRGNELGPYLFFCLSGESFCHDAADPEEQMRYKEYQDKYDDYYFNRHTVPNGALGEAITAIRVTSTIDFDAEHPAGAWLNDVIVVSGYSYYSFICNHCLESWQLDEQRERFNLLLSDLTPEKMILWETEGFFRLAAAPDPPLEELPLRFEFDFENGRTLVAETVISWVERSAKSDASPQADSLPTFSARKRLDRPLKEVLRERLVLHHP